MRKITILGSTGSIGVQALQVAESLGCEVLALGAGNNIELLLKQIKKFRPKTVSVKNPENAAKIKSEFPDIAVLSGEAGLIELCENTQNDIIIAATSGKIGLRPTLKAIESGINVALANKETLVMAGDIVMKKARERNVKILPVDSEHSAIFQCCEDFSALDKIIITASGGPFLHKTKKEMENMKAQDALKHPRWQMGEKITIDSSTLMNKGLEVIEAHHLFNLPYDKIDVVIHPQSIVHSAVEFKDGSVLAQLGVPSMHLPIQYAITYPKRVCGIKSKSFDFIGQNLTFEKPDFEKFPCLKLAYVAGKAGASAPVVLNAANEAAVKKFLKGEIKFSEIEKIVEKALLAHTPVLSPTLDEIFEIDREVTEKLS